MQQHSKVIPYCLSVCVCSYVHANGSFPPPLVVLLEQQQQKRKKKKMRERVDDG